MTRPLAVMFVIAALLVGLFAVPAKADWMRTLSSISIVVAGTTEITSQSFWRLQSADHWRITLNGATGFVAFLSLTSQNQTMSATQVNRVYLPSNEPTLAVSHPGPLISIMKDLAGGSILIIEQVEPAK